MMRTECPHCEGHHGYNECHRWDQPGNAPRLGRADPLTVLELYPRQPIQIRFTNGEYRGGTFVSVVFTNDGHPITMVVDDPDTGLRMRLMWTGIRSYRCTPPETP